MLAAAAILWITLDAEATTPQARIGRGWTTGLEGRASYRPLFVYPDFQSGVRLDGGFRLAHPLRAGAVIALTGDAGATFVDGWRPVFETAAEVSWRDRIGVRAGLRHDDRLRRENARADFRDPTGRIFLGLTAWPFRRGRIAAGAAIDYERALPGANRLPSGTSITAVGRFRWR